MSDDKMKDKKKPAPDKPLFEKPVDHNNQVENITDKVDPDLHKKPEK